ncbi:translation initiation factor IF-2-like [Schistocerca serialis cubense]|uniref:translation initiation factor IF-2-like n=1 Tax=Schistocerca serialis cubense TaxID=2023355 RepID=UPI00214E3ED4|nr:translation initiation factor IF-2-like [Schistocerca serialis cubense]
MENSRPVQVAGGELGGRPGRTAQRPAAALGRAAGSRCRRAGAGRGGRRHRSSAASYGGGGGAAGAAEARLRAAGRHGRFVRHPAPWPSARAVPSPHPRTHPCPAQKHGCSGLFTAAGNTCDAPPPDYGSRPGAAARQVAHTSRRLAPPARCPALSDGSRQQPAAIHTYLHLLMQTPQLGSGPNYTSSVVACYLYQDFPLPGPTSLPPPPACVLPGSAAAQAVRVSRAAGGGGAGAEAGAGAAPGEAPS